MLFTSWSTQCLHYIEVCYQFSSAAQSCPTPCDPMDCSTPGFPVHHQLPELAQTQVHRVMPSNHLILCHLLLLPSVFQQIIQCHKHNVSSVVKDGYLPFKHQCFQFHSTSRLHSFLPTLISFPGWIREHSKDFIRTKWCSCHMGALLLWAQ